MIQLRTKNLKKYYQRGPHLIKALDGIDLEVERGCFLAVMESQGAENLRCCICLEDWTNRRRGAYRLEKLS